MQVGKEIDITPSFVSDMMRLEHATVVIKQWDKATTYSHVGIPSVTPNKPSGDTIIVVVEAHLKSVGEIFLSPLMHVITDIPQRNMNILHRVNMINVGVHGSKR